MLQQDLFHMCPIGTLTSPTHLPLPLHTKMRLFLSFYLLYFMLRMLRVSTIYTAHDEVVKGMFKSRAYRWILCSADKTIQVRQLH